MNPIVSRYDVRLITLIGVAINALEAAGLETDVNPEQLLSDYLYLVTRQVHEVGEEQYLDKLATNYPMLNEAIS